MSDIKALEAAQAVLHEAVAGAVSADRNGPEEEIVDAPEGSVLESSLDEPWEPTHSIGVWTVQQKQYVDGLNYWIEKDGKRRRPTKERPLRAFVPKPEPAQAMWLDSDALALCLVAFLDPDPTAHAENEENIADQVDEDHVRLSLYDREHAEYTRFLIQIPKEFEVIGSKLR